jgi:hypothetical protein
MTLKRFNQFPEGSGSLSNDDIFLFMDDPSGSALTKKVSVSVLQSGLIQSNTGLVNNSIGITNIISISQSNYDALATKDPNTLYIING